MFTRLPSVLKPILLVACPRCRLLACPRLLFVKAKIAFGPQFSIRVLTFPLGASPSIWRPLTYQNMVADSIYRSPWVCSQHLVKLILTASMVLNLLASWRWVVNFEQSRALCLVRLLHSSLIVRWLCLWPISARPVLLRSVEYTPTVVCLSFAMISQRLNRLSAFRPIIRSQNRIDFRYSILRMSGGSTRQGAHLRW